MNRSNAAQGEAWTDDQMEMLVDFRTISHQLAYVQRLAFEWGTNLDKETRETGEPWLQNSIDGWMTEL